jgi:hypothetical protein
MTATRVHSIVRRPMKNPFRLKFWVVFHNGMQKMVVIKQRLAPWTEKTYTTMGVVLLDGPFDSDEDAARSLGFWQRQYSKPLSSAGKD